MSRAPILFLALTMCILLSSCAAAGNSGTITPEVSASEQPSASPSGVSPSALPTEDINRVLNAIITPDEAAAYAPVLVSWKTAIEENFGLGEETYEEKSYPFVVSLNPVEHSLAHCAYYDLDGNAVSELLIASFSDVGYFCLADVFTLRDGNPVRLFEGVEDKGFWARNRLDFSRDGKSLIVTSSAGAAYTKTDFYRVSDSGYEVELIEGASTYNPDNMDDPVEGASYYRSPDGTYEAADDTEDLWEKYYDVRYTDGYPDYCSDFNRQLDWQPVVKTSGGS